MLGELLVADKVVTAEAIKDALLAAKERGGKLGTNLIELAYLEEDVLARYLGQQFDCDYLFGEIAVDPEVLALVDPELADQHDIVPYKVDGKRLTVLVMGPRNPEQFDQLQFQLGYVLEQVVVPEFRLQELLRRHYRCFRDERGLSQRPARAKNRPDPKKQRLAESAELIDESEFQALYAQVLAGDAAPAEAALEELEVLEGAELEPIEEPVVPAGLPAVATPDELFELERRETDRRWHKRTIPADRRRGARRGSGEGAEDDTPPIDLGFDIDAAIADAKADTRRIPAPPIRGGEAVPPGPPVGPPVAAPVVVAPPVAVHAVSTPPDGRRPAQEPPVVARTAAPAAGPRTPATPLVPPPAAVVEVPLDRHGAEALLESGGRDDIARALVRFGISKFKRAMVLAIQGEVAAGWDGLGGKLDRALAKKVTFPLSQPSVFQLVWDTKSHYLGQFKVNPIVVYFLRATGGEVPKTSFLMPILVNGKCVNLFYADNGHQKLASRDVGELLLLGQRAGRAYQRLIEAKRKRA